MEKLKLHTPDRVKENVAKLAELFPSCVTEARDDKGNLIRSIDFDQLRQELADHVVDGPRERYHLDWPGKRKAIHLANSPVAKTLRPARAESVNFETTKNLFIEGDNLDALKLLQEIYLNQVKLVYIDPPYNTGKDFVYRDDFSEAAEEYLIRSQQIDDCGNRLLANPESNGRFHSDWLSMMYSRLKLARNLLTPDGIVCVSIDDHECASLRQLCDEVFGRECFLAQIVIQANKRGQTYKEVAKTHEYVVLYSRTGEVSLNEIDKSDGALPYTDSLGPFDLWELRNRNPKFGRFNRPNLFFPVFVAPDDLDECGYAHVSLCESDAARVKVLPVNSEGIEGCWRWGKDKINSVELTGSSPVLVAKRRRDGGWNVYEKSRKATTKVKSIWNDTEVISEQGTIELGQLGLSEAFDHPKPKALIQRCIHMATSDDDLVVDFFAGSATTADAVMSLNAEDGGTRRFILVQIPATVDADGPARKAGFSTLADVSKERIRRAGNRIRSAKPLVESHLDTGFRVLKIDTSNVKEVFYTPDESKQGDLLKQIDNIREDRTAEDLLFQVLVDWGVDLALPIAQETIDGRTVFFVDGNALAACFDPNVTDELVKEIAKRKPLRAVFRDSSYSSDSVKINVEQIFKLLAPSTEIRSL